MELFAEKWDKQYPSKSWLSHWQHFIPFFALPAETRKVIYTTNAIESINSSLRKVIKSLQILPANEQVGLFDDAKYLKEVDYAD